MASFKDEERQKDILLLRKRLLDLPDFLQEFFRGIQSTAAKTRLGYALDLKLFFEFLHENHKAFQDISITDITIEYLDIIESEDIDRFLEYITYYTRPNPQKPGHMLDHQNDEKGKARKLAAVRALFKYYYKKKKIKANPAAIVDGPKIHIKQIVRLDPDETAKLLDEVETGRKLCGNQQAHHKRTKLRDLAIVTLLLGTGMRVSECIGININDLDFQNNGVKVTRKGGDEAMLYFGQEVRDALENYLNERKDLPTKKDDEECLFLSSQGKRISVRAVQNLVKKYASLVTTTKKISPHKLRSTYGTTLYQETGDIYLVADVLGHADVNTTQKHYAAMEESRRRSAAKFVKLRKDT